MWRGDHARGVASSVARMTVSGQAAQRCEEMPQETDATHITCPAALRGRKLVLPATKHPRPAVLLGRVVDAGHIESGGAREAGREHGVRMRVLVVGGFATN